MDKIEMIIQKYGDKIQVGYQTLRDQFVIHDILLTFTLIALALFFVTIILLTFINTANDYFDYEYFNKKDIMYNDHKIKRMFVYLNVILPVIFLLIFIICIVLNGILTPDYGFIKSLIGG